MNPEIKTDILILGAGIGGYEAFRTLSRLLKRHRLAKHIIIIDQNNYFSFTPLNHEVAAGAVEPTHAALPLRELVHKTPHRFLKASVKKIDPEKKLVETSRGTIGYDYCVVAMGSSTNFYNTPGAEKFSYHVRTLSGAMILRHNLIEALESDDEKIDITVVGGGYTGVEVAGQLQHFANHDARALYPDKKILVRLVQTIGTVVPQLPAAAQQKIVKRLRRMGVDILFNTSVKEVKKKAVMIEQMTTPSSPPSQGGETADDRDRLTPPYEGGAAAGRGGGKEELPSDFTVWCAGFGNIANCFVADSLCTADRRLPTNQHLQHAKYPSLYAIGDIALIFNQNETKPLPQLGEAAYHEGRYAAEHIIATLQGKNLPPFNFVSKGTLMPIGERYGIGVIKSITFSGIFAWWLRRTVYLTFMPGILRKLRIVVDWTLRLFGFSYTIAVERSLEKGPKNQ